MFPLIMQQGCDLEFAIDNIANGEFRRNVDGSVEQAQPAQVKFREF